MSQLATAGATSISGIALYLRPGTREWFLAWLRRTHPELVDRYAQLYARGAYVPKAYSEDLQQRLRAVQASVRVTDARTART